MLVAYVSTWETYPQDSYYKLFFYRGHIYYEQKKYPSAIKMYRMALDQTPTSAKMLR